MEKLSASMLAVFVVKQFSDSRWLTLGEHSRRLTAAMSLGVVVVVDYCRTEKKVGDYYLHGFTRLGPEHLKFIVVVGMSSFVGDAVLAELAEDGRLVVRALELGHIVQEELTFLGGLPDSTWDRVAAIVREYIGFMCRTDVTRAATTATAYFDEHIFRRTRQHPLRLGGGDVEGGLELRRTTADAVTDPVAFNIAQLLRSGFIRQALCAGVHLIREARWIG